MTRIVSIVKIASWSIWGWKLLILAESTLLPTFGECKPEHTNLSILSPILTNEWRPHLFAEPFEPLALLLDGGQSGQKCCLLLLQRVRHFRCRRTRKLRWAWVKVKVGHSPLLARGGKLLERLLALKKEYDEKQDMNILTAAKNKLELYVNCILFTAFLKDFAAAPPPEDDILFVFFYFCIMYVHLKSCFFGVLMQYA